MPSDLIGIREIPSSPPPRKTTFVYVAFLSGLVMLLAAGALYLHVYLTNQWLKQLKVDAVSRESVASAESSPIEDSNRCPAEKPVLIGFDANGKSLCRALPTPCRARQYIASIDPVSLELHCADAGAIASCPEGSYLTEFAWTGEGRISYSCHARLDPFAAWKFTPVLGSRGND